MHQGQTANTCRVNKNNKTRAYFYKYAIFTADCVNKNNKTRPYFYKYAIFTANNGCPPAMTLRMFNSSKPTWASTVPPAL